MTPSSVRKVLTISFLISRLLSIKPLSKGGQGFLLRPEVPHGRDLPLVERDDGGHFLWPLGSADLGRVSHHDDRVSPSVENVDPSAGEPLLVAVPKRLHDILSAVTVPVSRLERAPLHAGIQHRLNRRQVALLPGVEALPRQRYRLIAHMDLLSSR